MSDSQPAAAEQEAAVALAAPTNEPPPDENDATTPEAANNPSSELPVDDAQSSSDEATSEGADNSAQQVLHPAAVVTPTGKVEEEEEGTSESELAPPKVGVEGVPGANAVFGEEKMEELPSTSLKPPPAAPGAELKADCNIEPVPTDFVNQGLAMWEKCRLEWLSRDSDSSPRAVATPIDVDDIIDVIFASPRVIREEGGPRKFPKPVPLPQMIDILVDLWEAEGLDV